MKLYFSSRHIPALAHLPLQQRLSKLREASSRLTGPEKMLLNLVKLLVLLPPFVLILRLSDGWTAIIWVALLLLAYPLLLRPLQYGLCEKYISLDRNQ